MAKFLVTKEWNFMIYVVKLWYICYNDIEIERIKNN